MASLGIALCLLVIGACQIVPMCGALGIPAITSCRYGWGWKSCGHHLTCDNMMTYDRGADCYPGCFCKDNKVRNRKGECIDFDRCDVQNECPENEMFTECGPGLLCDSTCEKRSSNCSESDGCNRRCVCKPGYVRLAPAAKCMLPEECPNEKMRTLPRPKLMWNLKPQYSLRMPIENNWVPAVGVSRGNNTSDPIPSSSPESPKKNRKRREMRCHQNEVFSKCEGSPRCQDFCNNDKLIVCPLTCRSGCVCKEGYIRKVPRGMCIPQNQCPVVHRCPANEIYASCGGNRRCEDYCNRKQPLSCPLVCYDGCTCKEGYIRKVPGGTCIPKHQCPKHRVPKASGSYRPEGGVRKRRSVVCSANEMYSECASMKSCQRYCGAIGGSCGLACQRGCECRPGYVRNVKGGTCIPENKCPNDIIGKSDIKIHDIDHITELPSGVKVIRPGLFQTSTGQIFNGYTKGKDGTLKPDLLGL